VQLKTRRFTPRNRAGPYKKNAEEDPEKKDLKTGVSLQKKKISLAWLVGNFGRKDSSTEEADMRIAEKGVKTQGTIRITEEDVEI